MVTTCMGEMAEHMLVKPTTSLNRIVQMSNTYNEKEQKTITAAQNYSISTKQLDLPPAYVDTDLIKTISSSIRIENLEVRVFMYFSLITYWLEYYNALSVRYIINKAKPITATLMLPLYCHAAAAALLLTDVPHRC